MIEKTNLVILPSRSRPEKVDVAVKALQERHTQSGGS